MPTYTFNHYDVRVLYDTTDALGDGVVNDGNTDNSLVAVAPSCLFVQAASATTLTVEASISHDLWAPVVTVTNSSQLVDFIVRKNKVRVRRTTGTGAGLVLAQS